MKTVVVQFDTREEEVHGELATQNREYAARAGYAYEFVKGDIREINPYWGKVRACLKVAESGLYERMLFLDSDAAVMDFDFRIEPLLEDGTLFAASGAGGFNVGVFAMPLGDDGVSLLREWMSHYKPDRWWTNGKEWKCPGQWAGPDYEQGSLNLFVAPKHPGRMKDVGWRTFLHCDSHRTNPNRAEVKEFQAFVAAMRESKVVHFCRWHRELARYRWRAFEGRLVVFDDTATDRAEEKMKAFEKCREAPK